MIQNLHIENFKSIKNLQLACKKVNIFIGEPNSGKSNIIEALSLFSMSQNNMRQIIRLQNLTDLFYDNLTDKPILISFDDVLLKISPNKQNLFEFAVKHGDRTFTNFFDITGHVQQFHGWPNHTPIRFYSYKSDVGSTRSLGVLNTPHGDNLVSIIISNSSFKSLVQDIFKSKGFRLKIKPVENQIEISKEKDDEIYSYAYSNISETLKRIIFFMACLETNIGSTLIFDEPEANTFPFYTKYFAERISLDETNQFFFTTHNPYLLESIVAKSSPDDLNVIIAYMEDYETKLRVLTKSEVSELMEIDAFFNLKRYTEQV